MHRLCDRFVARYFNIYPAFLEFFILIYNLGKHFVVKILNCNSPSLF